MELKIDACARGKSQTWNIFAASSSSAIALCEFGFADFRMSTCIQLQHNIYRIASYSRSHLHLVSAAVVVGLVGFVVLFSRFLFVSSSLFFACIFSVVSFLINSLCALFRHFTSAFRAIFSLAHTLTHA